MSKLKMNFKNNTCIDDNYDMRALSLKRHGIHAPFLSKEHNTVYSALIFGKTISETYLYSKQFFKLEDVTPNDANAEYYGIPKEEIHQRQHIAKVRNRHYLDFISSKLNTSIWALMSIVIFAAMMVNSGPWYSGTFAFLQNSLIGFFILAFCIGIAAMVLFPLLAIWCLLSKSLANTKLRALVDRYPDRSIEIFEALNMLELQNMTYGEACRFLTEQNYKVDKDLPTLRDVFNK